MKKTIDTVYLEQYLDLFGKEKILLLFAEYKNKINEDMPKILELYKKNDLNGLRIIYHSLASASLVFGMKKFASVCRKIEDFILDGKDIKALESYIKQSEVLLNDEKKQVESYLENNNE